MDREDVDRELLLQAEAGDVRAMIRLSRRTRYRGDGESAAWMRKAADAGSPVAMFKLGELADGWEYFDEAAHWYEQAADAGHYGAAHALTEVGTRQAAIEARRAKWLSAADAGDLNARSQLAGDLERHRGMAEALPHYQLCAESGDEPVIRLLVKHHLDRNEIEDANRWLRHSISMGLSYPSSVAGQSYQHAGDLRSAVTWFREAAELGDGFSMQSLGEILISLGELDEAEIWLRRAADTEWPDSKAALGRFLGAQGRLEEAEAALRRAADSGTPEGQIALADFLIAQGELDEAETWLRAASQQGWGEPSLARLLYDKGDLKGAEKLFTALAHDDYKNTFAMLGLGILLLKRNRLEGALVWVQTAAIDYPYAVFVEGHIQMRLGKPALAEACFREAADKGEPEAMQELAALLTDRGEAAEAESWRLRAQDPTLSSSRPDFVPPLS